MSLYVPQNGTMIIVLALTWKLIGDGYSSGQNIIHDTLLIDYESVGWTIN